MAENPCAHRHVCKHTWTHTECLIRGYLEEVRGCCRGNRGKSWRDLIKDWLDEIRSVSLLTHCHTHLHATTPYTHTPTHTPTHTHARSHTHTYFESVQQWFCPCEGGGNPPEDVTFDVLSMGIQRHVLKIAADQCATAKATTSSFSQHTSASLFLW